jgi:hypothetical protein
MNRLAEGIYNARVLGPPQQLGGGWARFNAIGNGTVSTLNTAVIVGAPFLPVGAPASATEPLLIEDGTGSVILGTAAPDEIWAVRPSITRPAFSRPGMAYIPFGRTKPLLQGDYPVGMGAYSEVGGHHPLSGKAFAYKGYQDAVAIGKDYMRSNGWGHPQPLTTFQQQGYLAFGETGEPLTMTRMAQIEVDAMVKASIPKRYAEEAVSAAIWQRFDNGEFTPKYIPWVGPNPGARRLGPKLGANR